MYARDGKARSLGRGLGSRGREGGERISRVSGVLWFLREVYDRRILDGQM